MVIKIAYAEVPVVCRFVRYGRGWRMWMTDDNWYPTVGWCPHINVGGGECRDCSLVLEDD